MSTAIGLQANRQFWLHEPCSAGRALSAPVTHTVLVCQWQEAATNEPAEVVLTQQLLRGPARLSPLLLCSHTRPLLCPQAQERIDKAVSDADAMESQYESAYASARQTYSRGRALLDEIQRVGTC